MSKIGYMLAKVSWTRVAPDDLATSDGAEDVDSLEELDALLDRLDQSFEEGVPVLVVVQRPNQETLTIGLGPATLYPDDDDDDTDPRSVTVLNFCTADGNPPTYTSLTSEPYPGDVAYFYLGSDSEFGGKAVIKKEVGREAVRLFVTQPGLPTNVDWEQD